MLKYETIRLVTVQDWDKLVRDTYGRPYSFQQQEGCKARGAHRLIVPDEPLDFENDSVPEQINGGEMGVSFEAWKVRDPLAPVSDHSDPFLIGLFWARNFYPDVQMVANDLYSQGKIEAGDYIIDIDW